MAIRNTAETVFTGDAAGLLQAYQQIREAQRKQDAEMRELKRATQEAHREERQNLAEAARMYREVQTPLEQYRDKVKQIEKAYESGIIDQQTYNRQLARQKDLLDQTATSTGAAATAIKSLATAFAGFFGVQQLIAALNAELENLRKLAEDTRKENITFAQQMQQTRNAFQADATLSDEQLEPRMIAAAKEARVDSTTFAAAMQDTFSAKGDATNEEAVQAQIAAFRVARDLEGSRTLAARALDMRQATGSTDFMANIGFLQNVQANSRVTSLARVGQHLLPGITGVMTRGDTPEEAAEFVATLNTLMQDAEGATTRTAATSLSGQLRDFKPRRRADRERYEALESTTTRLQFLQGNPALSQEFLDTASFEQGAAPFIEKMVTGSADALAVQADKQAKIQPLDARQAAALERQIASKEASERAQLLTNKEQSDINIEQSRLQDTPSAREAEARSILFDTLGATNFKGLDLGEQTVLGYEFEARMGQGAVPATAAADTLRQHRPELASMKDQQLFDTQIDLLERIANGIENLHQPASPAAAQSR